MPATCLHIVWTLLLVHEEKVQNSKRIEGTVGRKSRVLYWGLFCFVLFETELYYDLSTMLVSLPTYIIPTNFYNNSMR